MAEETDSALVARARRGDAGAFKALVQRYLRAALAVGTAVLRNPHDAEEIAQEAFATAYTSLDSCRDPEHFSAWLLTIVRNRALNTAALRSRRGAVDLAAGEPDSRPAGAEVLGERELLLHAMETLTSIQREVLLLHDLESWTHAEIAASLGISDVSSRQHLFNARRAMRTLLQDTGHG